MKRMSSFGKSELSFVDRFGVWLSNRAIRKAIRNRHDLDILEIGCGYHAKNLRNIEAIATSLTAVDIDISEDIINNPKYRAIKGSANDALSGLANERYDLIMLISVLEHLIDPNVVLNKCYSLLKPQGTLIINVPTWTGKVFLEFSAYKLGLSPAEEMDDHKMYYSKRDLWPILVSSGFKPIDIQLYYHKFLLNLFAISRKT